MASLEDSIESTNYEGADTAIAKYFREMARHPLFTRAEELEVGKHIYDAQNALYTSLETLDSAFVNDFSGEVKEDEEGQPIQRWHVAIHIGSDYIGRINAAMKDESEDKSICRKLLSRVKTELEKKYSSLTKSSKKSVTKEVYDFLRFVDPQFVAYYSHDSKKPIPKKLVKKMVEIYFSELDRMVDKPENSKKWLQNLKGKLGGLYSSVIRERDKMVRANLRLVVAIAKKYQGRGLSLDDLVGEGNLGLIKASERFDYSKGFKFTTYGAWWIKHSIRIGIMDKGKNIRIPVNAREKNGKITKAEKKIERSEGIEKQYISDERIAKETGLSLKQVKNFRHLPSTISHDVPIAGDEESTTFLDMTPDTSSESSHDQLGKKESSERIASIIEKLPPMLREIMERRFYEGHTLEQIAVDYDVTRERIRQLQVKALGKLVRKSGGEEEIRTLLSES